MVDLALVGRCGIYCGACGAHRAYKDKQAPYFQQQIKEFQFPIEGIRCEGCHALTPQCAGSQCKVVQCLDSKGFEYCYECPTYENQSCKKYGEIAKKCADRGVDIRANLDKIKSGDVEAWLKECEEGIKCPRCGKPLPVFGYSRKKCYHCGTNLPI